MIQPRNKQASAENVDLAVEAAVYGVTYFGHGAGRIMAVAVPLFLASLEPSAFLIGLAFGARHLPSLFLSIATGSLMDRFGTRQVLIFFSAIGIAVPLLYPAMPWVPLLIVLQMVLGFVTSLSWQGAQTLCGQLMGGSPKHAGRLAIVNQLGSLTCPLIVGAVWDYWGVWASFLTMSLWELAFLACCIALPKGGVATAGERAPAKMTLGDLVPRLSDYVDAFKLMRIPAVAFVVVLSLLDHCAVGIHQSFYVVYLEGIHLSGTAIGALVSTMSVGSVIGSMLVGPAAHWFNNNRLLLVSMTVSILAIALTPLLGGIYVLLLIAACVRGLFDGLAYPLIIVVMSRAVGRSDQGKAVGVRTTGNRLVGTFVPVIMGLVAEGIGLGGSFLAVGTALMMAMTAVGIWLYRTPALRG